MPLPPPFLLLLLPLSSSSSPPPPKACARAFSPAVSGFLGKMPLNMASLCIDCVRVRVCR